MPRYKLSTLALWVDGKMNASGDPEISKLLIDSRKLFEPSETLFVAIRGAQHDGHQYINGLYVNGVRAFLVDGNFSDASLYPDASFCVVEHTLRAFQKMAEAHRRLLNTPILAITGSNGKTIVKEWISHLLGHEVVHIRSPRSYNSQVGVPLSLWLLEPQVKLGIIEAGISMPGEMARLEQMIAPDMVLFTNLGQAHQENFESLEQKKFEKTALALHAGAVFEGGFAARPFARRGNAGAHNRVVSWGNSPFDDLFIHSVQTGAEGFSLLSCSWKERLFDVEIPFSDSASVENAMHALLFALHMGIAPDLLMQRCSTLQPIEMRMEQKEGHHNCLLINDAYNADVTSLEIALDFLHRQGSKQGLSATLILSDILQSGLAPDALCRRIEALLREKKVNRFIGIGPVLSGFLAPRMPQHLFFSSTQQFLSQITENDFRNEAILLKGSRSFMFERIAEMLELKRHRTVMEINLNALAHNIQSVRCRLQPGTRLLAMVKAFSYGSGSFEIASLMQHQQVDCLGVAFADEGYDLRTAGITLPIVVMSPDERSFERMLHCDLEPEIYNLTMLEKFAHAVQRQGLEKAGIHLKLDTGMYRLGFLEPELPGLLAALKQYPQVYVKSVFSHLVGSDEAEHDAFTLAQITAFEQACAQIKAVTGYGFVRHLLNSAGIERFPQAQYEMVRLGIGLYGISTEPHNDLRNVATLKSYVSQLKTVPAGRSVGYSRKSVVDADTPVAVIPVGYADGLDRRLSNGRGKLWINGAFAPIIGNICMDMCMANVTGIDVKEGDEVVVFGDAYPVWEMSQSVGTIPYEVLTGISRRVKRVYFSE